MNSREVDETENCESAKQPNNKISEWLRVDQTVMNSRNKNKRKKLEIKIIAQMKYIVMLRITHYTIVFSPVTAKLLLILLSSSVPVYGTLHKHIKTETHRTMSAFFSVQFTTANFRFSASLSAPLGVCTHASRQQVHTVLFETMCFVPWHPAKCWCKLFHRKTVEIGSTFSACFWSLCALLSHQRCGQHTMHTCRAMPNHILPDTKPFRMAISANIIFRLLHRHWIKCCESAFSGYNQSFPSELFRSWPWWHRVNV